jgi:hypothetical protein
MESDWFCFLLAQILNLVWYSIYYGEIYLDCSTNKILKKIIKLYLIYKPIINFPDFIFDWPNQPGVDNKLSTA